MNEPDKEAEPLSKVLEELLPAQYSNKLVSERLEVDEKTVFRWRAGIVDEIRDLDTLARLMVLIEESDRQPSSSDLQRLARKHPLSELIREIRRQAGSDDQQDGPFAALIEKLVEAQRGGMTSENATAGRGGKPDPVVRIDEGAPSTGGAGGSATGVGEVTGGIGGSGSTGGAGGSAFGVGKVTGGAGGDALPSPAPRIEVEESDTTDEKSLALAPKNSGATAHNVDQQNEAVVEKKRRNQ